MAGQNVLGDMISIKATEISPPPAWALMERQLIELMEEAVDLDGAEILSPRWDPL